MRKCFALITRYVFASSAILTAAIIFAVKTDAQQAGGPYADVKVWTVSYSVIIKTKCPNFCTIQSEETTEGSPDKVINYSIYREFDGAYWVGGPIPKNDRVYLAHGRPAAGDPSRMEFAGYDWKQPNPKVSEVDMGSSNILYAKVQDEYDLSERTKECGTHSSHERNITFKFDSAIDATSGMANLSFDLKYRRYFIDLSILPVNVFDDLKIVKVKETNITQSNEPDEEKQPGKTISTMELLTKFLANSEKSIENPNLKFEDELPEGVEEIKICRNEKLKNFVYFDSAVTKDILNKNTVTVTIQLEIQKGKRPLTAPSAC